MKSMLNDLKPVRKIRPSSRSITGKFASIKTNTTHYFESSLERDYLILLEHDPEVYMFLAQPVSLFYKHDKKTRRYTPDILVHFNENLNRQPMLVEIKYAAELELKRVELQARFDAATNYAEARGFTFKIITELQIRTVYLDNLKFLSRYKGQINDDIARNILHALKDHNCTTARELLIDNNAEGNARILHTVWQMLSAGVLRYDMQSKITMTTLLCTNNQILPAP